MAFTPSRMIALVALTGIVALTAVVHASDFWDEVRTPGLAEYRRLIENARRALQAPRLTDAERAATEALAIIPNRTEPLVIRGVARGTRGAPQHGAEDLLHALAIDPAAVDSRWVDVATEILTKASALEEATLVLGRAIRLDGPGRARDHRFERYAHLTLAIGQGDDATAAYRESMRATGGSPHAWLGLALALRRTGGSDEEAYELATRAANTMALPRLLAHVLPDQEIAAREAIIMEVTGYPEAARSAWDRAREGVWSAHATAQSAALAREE